MKDHVEIGHLTKYDAFRVNRDRVMDLEIWFKIHTKTASLIFRQRPPKPYLSNRPQVSIGYRLINHAGCGKNMYTRRICKPRAAGEWFTNSSSALPTSQVVYQLITHRNLWPIAFIY